MIEMKNSSENFKNKLEQAEERISELYRRYIKIIQRRKKLMKRNKDTYRTYETPLKELMHISLQSLKEREERIRKLI